MTLAERRPQRLQIGHVVVQTFRTIRENILLFAALSVIPIGPALILRYEQSILQDEDFVSPLYALLATVFIVSFYFLTAAVARALVLQRTGHRPTLQDCLAEVARDFYPLAAIAIIASFITAVAVIVSPAYPISLLLLIPGFFIQVLLAVIVPVRTIERTGFVASFTRSIQLTKGHRWPILGLLVASTILSIASEFLAYAAVGDATFGEIDDINGTISPAFLWLIIGDLINGVIGSVGPVVVYFELRLIKEGAAPETVASVFD